MGAIAILVLVGVVLLIVLVLGLMRSCQRDIEEPMVFPGVVVTCGWCGGSGRIRGEPCPVCKKKGV